MAIIRRIELEGVERKQKPVEAPPTVQEPPTVPTLSPGGWIDVEFDLGFGGPQRVRLYLDSMVLFPSPSPWFRDEIEVKLRGDVQIQSKPTQEVRSAAAPLSFTLSNLQKNSLENIKGAITKQINPLKLRIDKPRVMGLDLGTLGRDFTVTRPSSNIYAYESIKTGEMGRNARKKRRFKLNRLAELTGGIL